MAGGPGGGGFIDPSAEPAAPDPDAPVGLVLFVDPCEPADEALEGAFEGPDPEPVPWDLGVTSCSSGKAAFF